MSYSACDLQTDLDEILAGLGYYIVGDDGDGWGYTFGPDDTSKPIRDGLDTAAEASELAMQDLAMAVGDLVDAGAAVVDEWETPKLAEAVRDLAVAVKVMDPARYRGDQTLVDRDALIRQLRRLQQKGLSFVDCISVFGERIADNSLAQRAHEEHHEPGVLEIEATTVVAEGDDGAYVLAWLWQPA